METKKKKNPKSRSSTKYKEPLKVRNRIQVPELWVRARWKQQIPGEAEGRDGAPVPVSGLCASAAAHLGTERLFCCWWVETCQGFAPDRVILERTSAFDVFFFFFPPLSAAERSPEDWADRVNQFNQFLFNYRKNTNCISCSNLSQGCLHLSPFPLNAPTVLVPPCLEVFWSEEVIVWWLRDNEPRCSDRNSGSALLLHLKLLNCNFVDWPLLSQTAFKCRLLPSSSLFINVLLLIPHLNEREVRMCLRAASSKVSPHPRCH